MKERAFGRVRPFEERVLEERALLRGDISALRERIERHARRPRSKEIGRVRRVGPVSA